MTAAATLDDNEIVELLKPDNCVRLIVISDIHASSTAGNATNVDPSELAIEANALVGAAHTLRVAAPDTDLVLCPGDLVHLGETTTAPWVWEQLQALAESVGARLVAAVGNHDIVRRPQPGEGPFDSLRALRPRFPLADTAQYHQYWSEDFGSFTSRDVRVVTMNTCALHGGFAESQSAYGRFKRSALKELRAHLAQDANSYAVNICVIHHHPFEWTHKGDGIVTHLTQGDVLVDLLSHQPDPWLLIHGHKHYPALGYLGRDTNGPAWLAAGSIGANVLGDTGTSVRNQMHVVDIRTDASTVDLALAGDVHSFDWLPGDGWAPATPSSGLPRRSGFGFRRSANDLLTLAMAAGIAAGQTTLRWHELEQHDARWSYLTPSDVAAFIRHVEIKGGGVVHPHDPSLREVTLP